MKLTVNRISLLKLAIMLIAILIGIFGLGRFGSNTVDASASGPNPSNTDAPGEANCRACHVQFPLNSGAGSVSISGVPSKWNPGQQIPLTVTTSQADGVVYGFQMTAIDYLGRRAGTLTLVPSTPQQTQIANGIVGGNMRQYISHTIDGILPTMFGSKSWNVTWTAPAQRIGSVSFYAAGNGSNSDGQTSGDYIYTTIRSSSSVASPFDFDGDAKTDVSIFRPGPGEWWVLRSSDGGNFATQFGASTDRMVPVDFTGDGKTDVAYWRPSTGFWFVLRSENFTFFAFPFGANGDIPAPADFDGDGKSDAAVFRPSSATWFISRSGDGGTTITQFGIPVDQPVAADYDGDGKADIGVFRTNGGNQEWWILKSTGGLFATVFGVPTDRAVQGDYTGDGKADIAFWRPSNGNWFILRSEDLSFFAFPFGTTGDVPVPGDYDGDGKFDAGVFRPTTFNWFVQRSTAGTLIQQFGIAGDLPTPNAFVR